MGRLLRFRRIKHAWPDEPLRLDFSLRRAWLDRLSTSQFTLVVIGACAIMVSVVFAATDLRARGHVQSVTRKAMVHVSDWWRQVPREVVVDKMNELDALPDDDWAEDGWTTKPRDVRRQQVSSTRCHPSYSGCLPMTGDVDCIGGAGNGPYFTGRVLVTGRDVYGLDRDGDGIGCE